MLTRLLVPLDGTIEAAAALPAAATLARAMGGTITLVRVAPGSIGDPDEARREGQRAEDEVRAAAEELAKDGLTVDWVVRPAPVAPSIIRAAELLNSDVIVMASHACSGLARVFAGSVSERVVADSSRPVLLVTPRGKRLDQIGTLLVPAGGALALGAAVRLAQAAGARLVLLDVVWPTPLWMYAGVGFAPATYIDPAWEEESLRSAETYVEGLSGRLRRAGLHVESRALKGEVAPTIQAVGINITPAGEVRAGGRASVRSPASDGVPGLRP
jgi:nucleotide-binding universal stress UspA family protein